MLAVKYSAYIYILSNRCHFQYVFSDSEQDYFSFEKRPVKIVIQTYPVPGVCHFPLQEQIDDEVKEVGDILKRYYL